jgi:hypothetical protein
MSGAAADQILMQRAVSWLTKTKLLSKNDSSLRPIDLYLEPD